MQAIIQMNVQERRLQEGESIQELQGEEIGLGNGTNLFTNSVLFSQKVVLVVQRLECFFSCNLVLHSFTLEALSKEESRYFDFFCPQVICRSKITLEVLGLLDIGTVHHLRDILLLLWRYIDHKGRSEVDIDLCLGEGGGQRGVSLVHHVVVEVREDGIQEGWRRG